MDSGLSAAKSGAVDDDLLQLAAAWTVLSPKAKAEIMAIVENGRVTNEQTSVVND